MTAPILIAHRGYAKHYPENTLPALEAALRAGACAVEFDVQLSADKVPVLCHDASLRRTTGVDKTVFLTPLAELATVCAGEATRFGEQFASVTLPTLAEVVTLLQQWPHATAFVEIKEESLRHFGIETVVRNVMKALAPVVRQCVIISYDTLAIRTSRAMGAVSTGWVLHKYDHATCISAMEITPDFLICNYTKIPPPPEPLWPGPWQWALYEVTNPEIACMLGKRGVELVETMAIGEMLRYPLLKVRGCFAA